MVWLQPRPDGGDVEWSAQASKLNFAVLNAPGQGVPFEENVHQNGGFFDSIGRPNFSDQISKLHWVE
jgi:hypothetical protein